jgi:hypothetical protein
MIEIVLARWKLQQPRRLGGRLNAEEAVKGQFGDAVFTSIILHLARAS